MDGVGVGVAAYRVLQKLQDVDDYVASTRPNSKICGPSATPAKTLNCALILPV